MNAEKILARLRMFLLILAGGIFAGSIVELWFTEHTKEPPQFIPFALCALGLILVAVGAWRPRRAVLFGLRIGMGVIALGGGFGIVLHVVNNIQFQVEIKPNAPVTLMDALGGANPLLAPGILALAALLALAATYSHPGLARRAG